MGIYGIYIFKLIIENSAIWISIKKNNSEIYRT
jgi:hypothetical protein